MTPVSAEVAAVRPAASARFGWFLAGIMLSAFALRMWVILGSPLLANDEAALAWSIETRSFRGLLQPLEFGQGAPLGFLMLSESAERLLGTTATAYRLLPMVWGLLAVAGVAVLASKVLPVPVALGVALTVAVSGSMVQYSAFFKQYSLDTFAAVLLLWIFAGLARKPSVEPTAGRHWLPLLSCGVVLPWFSHPSVFVFFGGATVLVVKFVAEGRFRAAGMLLLVGAAVAASFGVHYFAFARHLNASDFLQEFWGGQMLPDQVGALEVAKWIFRSALDWAATAIGVSPVTAEGRIAAAIALALTLLGFGALWRRDRVLAALLMSPVAVAFAAASVRMYPFSGRLLLFVVPGSLLLLGCGVVALCRKPRLATSVLVFASMALLSVWLRPHGNDHHRLDLAQACSTIAPQLGTRDHVYIFYPNRMVCFYALVHSNVPSHAVTAGAGDSPGAFEGLSRVEREIHALPLAQWRQVWVILSHPRLRDDRDEGEVVLMHFRAHCQEESLERRGQVRVVKFICGPVPKTADI